MSDLKPLRKILKTHLSYWEKVKRVDAKFTEKADELGDAVGKSAFSRAVSLGKALEAKNEAKITKYRESLCSVLSKKIYSIDTKIEKEKEKERKRKEKEAKAKQAEAAKAKAAKEKAKAKAAAAKAKGNGDAPKKRRTKKSKSVKRSASVRAPSAYSLFGGESFQYEDYLV